MCVCVCWCCVVLRQAQPPSTPSAHWIHTPTCRPPKLKQLLTAARVGAMAKAEVAIVETGGGERATFMASFSFQSKPFQVCVTKER